jgi:hypothetical protein
MERILIRNKRTEQRDKYIQVTAKKRDEMEIRKWRERSDLESGDE